jgi:class 3 adenylate cyclase
MSETRKIAAILVADVVGYSRLAEQTRIVPCRASGGCAAI